MTKKEWTIIGVLGAAVIVVLLCLRFLVLGRQPAPTSPAVAQEATPPSVLPTRIAVPPTSVPSATNTPRATDTPLPLTATRIPPQVMANQQVDLREGPGLQFAAAGNLPSNTNVPVLGKSEDGKWLQIAYPTSTNPSWVSTSAVNLIGATDTIPTRMPPPTTSPMPSATRIPSTNTPQPQPKLGDVVQRSGYTLSIVAISNPAKPGMFYQLESGKKLFAVEAIVGNVSGNKTQGNVLLFSLIDQNGFVYNSELMSLDSEIAPVVLNPGQKVRGWVAFNVPTSARGTAIRYRFSYVPDVVLEIALPK